MERKSIKADVTCSDNFVRTYRWRHTTDDGWTVMVLAVTLEYVGVRFWAWYQPPTGATVYLDSKHHVGGSTYPSDVPFGFAKIILKALGKRK